MLATLNVPALFHAIYVPTAHYNPFSLQSPRILSLSHIGKTTRRSHPRSLSAGSVFR